MPTRREIVQGGLLTLVFGTGSMSSCLCRAQPPGARHDYGCVLSPDEATLFMNERTDTRLYISGNEPMIPRSGDRDFDLALAHMLAAVSEKLEALPGFAYFDDYDGANAYATPTVRMTNADGTVLFGQRLLSRLMSGPESPEVAVAAVCAHEFGHILQFKRGLDREIGADQPTVKRVELQADFFAGYFAGARKLERPNFPAAVFAMTQHSFGDNMVNHPSHHGTSEERGAAIVKGFEVAYREKRTLAQAIQISTNYVAGL